jgi:hypothetical protein
MARDGVIGCKRLALEKQLQYLTTLARHNSESSLLLGLLNQDLMALATVETVKSLTDFKKHSYCKSLRLYRYIAVRRMNQIWPFFALTMHARSLSNAQEHAIKRYRKVRKRIQTRTPRCHRNHRWVHHHRVHPDCNLVHCCRHSRRRSTYRSVLERCKSPPWHNSWADPWSPTRRRCFA